MTGTDVDERERAALARLTANEKECLRRRLLPQTAKEMALDLGISPHAVEKRLKMARAKLGVSSSLAAARLLVAADGHGAVGAQAAGLSDAEGTGQDSAAASPVLRRRRMPPATPAIGAVLMILVTALLALVPQAEHGLTASPVVSGKKNEIVILPADSPGPHAENEPATERVEDVRMRPAGATEVEAFVRSSFRTVDMDSSGYIELAEAPAAGVGIGDPQPVNGPSAPDAKISWFAGPRGRAMWISDMDENLDGRVSEAEYVVRNTKIWRDHVPANWAWRR